MDLAEMGAYLSTPQPSDLLRVETLPWYDSAADDPHFARFRAGQPAQVDEQWQGWLDRIAAPGTQWRRVRIIASDKPLNEYLSFEFGEQYTRNTTAGEDIRILEVGESFLRVRTFVDFWVADSARAALVNYDDGGKFINASKAEGPAADYWALHAAHLWAEGVPFDQWWANYRAREAA